MRYFTAMSVALLLIVSAGAQNKGKNNGWITLFDGSSLANWEMTGNANWKLAGGIVEANSGSGFLVTKASYKDYELRAEIWVDEPANSGVFLRCTDPKTITQANAYEVNVYDTRPDQTYATGAIVDVAKPSQPMKAAGKWNTIETLAQGDHLVVKMNGVQTVDVHDSKHADGRIGLQYQGGVVRFRKVEIRPL